MSVMLLDLPYEMFISIFRFMNTEDIARMTYSDRYLCNVVTKYVRRHMPLDLEMFDLNVRNLNPKRAITDEWTSRIFKWKFKNLKHLFGKNYRQTVKILEACIKFGRIITFRTIFRKHKKTLQRKKPLQKFLLACLDTQKKTSVKILRIILKEKGRVSMSQLLGDWWDGEFNPFLELRNCLERHRSLKEKLQLDNIRYEFGERWKKKIHQDFALEIVSTICQFSDTREEMLKMFFQGYTYNCSSRYRRKLPLGVELMRVIKRLPDRKMKKRVEERIFMMMFDSSPARVVSGEWFFRILIPRVLKFKKGESICMFGWTVVRVGKNVHVTGRGKVSMEKKFVVLEEFY